MTLAELTRTRERLDASKASGRPGLDCGPLLGFWVNFEAQPTGVLRLEIRGDSDALAVRAFGTGSPEPSDWGEAPAQAFADDVASGTAVAFSTSFDHGFQRVALVGYLNRGVLAVDAATTFADGSGRSPYFTRALFYLP
jgi:hypothetical protein